MLNVEGNDEGEDNAEGRMLNTEGNDEDDKAESDGKDEGRDLNDGKDGDQVPVILAPLLQHSAFEIQH